MQVSSGSVATDLTDIWYADATPPRETVMLSKTNAVRLSLVCVFSQFVMTASAQTLTQQQPVIGRFGVGTTISSPSFGGIAIDPNGIASVPGGSTTNATLDIAALRRRTETTLPGDLFKPSKLRKVSLVRLERELGRRLDKERPISSDMLCLAGLTRGRLHHHRS